MGTASHYRQLRFEGREGGTDLFDSDSDLLELLPNTILELLDIDPLGPLRIIDLLRSNPLELTLRRSEQVFLRTVFFFFKVGNVFIVMEELSLKRSVFSCTFTSNQREKQGREEETNHHRRIGILPAHPYLRRPQPYQLP